MARRDSAVTKLGTLSASAGDHPCGSRASFGSARGQIADIDAIRAACKCATADVLMRMAAQVAKLVGQRALAQSAVFIGHLLAFLVCVRMLAARWSGVGVDNASAAHTPTFVTDNVRPPLEQSKLKDAYKSVLGNLQSVRPSCTCSAKPVPCGCAVSHCQCTAVCQPPVTDTVTSTAHKAVADCQSVVSRHATVSSCGVGLASSHGGANFRRRPGRELLGRARVTIASPRDVAAADRQIIPHDRSAHTPRRAGRSL